MLDADQWAIGHDPVDGGRTRRDRRADAPRAGACRDDARRRDACRDDARRDDARDRPAAGDRPWAGTLAVVLGIAMTTTGAHGGASPGEAASGDAAAAAVGGGVARPGPDRPPAQRLSTVPGRGAVAVLDGASTEQVAVRDAAYAGDRVTARLDVSDVDLVPFRVDVAWYDADGVLVASARHVVEPQDVQGYRTAQGVAGFPFEVAAPGGVAASLAVPVLVEE